ncbi:hypothetical protein BH11MYX4_BH11MYX4_29740 [soil metagenome]|nr:hypothetical protein [Labilithrix sp.]
MKTTTLTSILAASLLAAVAGCSASDSAAPSPDPQTEDELNSAAVTLHIPLLEEVKVGKSTRRRLISARNADFKKAGLAEMPEFVTVTAKDAGKSFSDAAARVDAAAEKLKLADGIEMIRFGDGSELEGRFGTKKEGICYTGKAQKALDLFLSLGDNVLSDQFTLKAWKFKHDSFDSEGKPFAGSEAQADEENYPEVWKEWRGAGDAILIISSTSDGGEENSPTILRKCK